MKSGKVVVVVLSSEELVRSAHSQPQSSKVQISCIAGVGLFVMSLGLTVSGAQEERHNRGKRSDDAVANRDEEAAGVASHAFVLAKAEPNTQHAVSVGALAEVLVQLLVGIKQVRFRDLGDPLVDLPIERLVLRQSLLTGIHSTGP